MNNYEKTRYVIFKETVKEILKNSATPPGATQQQKQTIGEMVEKAALGADYIESFANATGLNLEDFVLKLFSIEMKSEVND